MKEPYRLHREKIEQAQNYLRRYGIDCWLIRTKEGSDPCMPLMFGFSIVGDALLIITPDERIALTSVIDAQDARESGLFDTMHTYGPGGLNEKLFTIIDAIAPKRIALNYSKENHLADGLTVGSYRTLLSMLTAKYASTVESSEPFLQEIRSIKSPQEVAYIQKAIDITLEIYDEVFSKIRKGMTEIELGNSS